MMMRRRCLGLVRGFHSAAGIQARVAQQHILRSSCVPLQQPDISSSQVIATSSLHTTSSNGEESSSGWSFRHLAYGTAGICAGAAAFFWYVSQQKALCKQSKPKHEPGAAVDKLPTYTSADVSKHNSAATGIWVTYKNGVYDISEFVSSHPGGDKIMLAAGGSLEPFFELYGIHKTKEVMEIVESLRIGNIFDKKPKRIPDAYQKDPERSVALIVNSEKPFNAEPPLQLLTDSFITPNSIFFVRNHLPVPIVDDKMLKEYKLEVKVDKPGKQPRHLKPLHINDIKKLPKYDMTATMQCAGNRRKEMSTVKEVKGLSWNCGSISTATWTGARLIDVLHAMGFKDEDLKTKYVQFEGLDVDPTGTPYGSSIATEKALDPNHSIMIAYEMNGEPIPEDHGYPLRVIIPGVVGARNVKWLKKIVVSDDESPSHWQRKDYKCFNPSIDFSTCNFDLAAAVQETPVQSAISEPATGAVIDADDEYITVKGYAFSGGGRGIFRVDLSLDGGKTWCNPELNTNGQSPYKSWAWTLWETTVPIPPNHKGKLDIVCKAIDSSHNVQPESVEGIWNLRGLLNNSWHRVTVKVQ